MVTQKKRNNGEVNVEIGKTGIRVHFSNTPKWAYILIAIGLMFGIIIICHGVYKMFDEDRGAVIEKIADKLTKGTPLTDKDVEMLDSLTPEERKELGNDIKKKENLHYIELDGFKLEQNVPPGTKTTIIKDGERVSIKKGSTDE